MKQKGFAHAFIIVGIIALLAGALGVVFWKNLTKDNVADISTWKTYESDTIPITFKYPSNWKEVKQDRPNYVRLFGGSTDSVKGYSLGVFYGQNMANRTPEPVACSDVKETKSCERYQTDAMSGLIVGPKIGADNNHESTVGVADYEFRATVGADNYVFSVNNGYMDESTFKELLNSIRLK